MLICMPLAAQVVPSRVDMHAAGSACGTLACGYACRSGLPAPGPTTPLAGLADILALVIAVHGPVCAPPPHNPAPPSPYPPPGPIPHGPLAGLASGLHLSEGRGALQAR